jgi:hypothetical protein
VTEEHAKYHAEWMDEPIVDIHDFEATQLHFYKGNVFLASRYKNGQGSMFQKWHVPVMRKKGSKEEFVGSLKQKLCTAVMVGRNLEEAKQILDFFSAEVQKMIDAERDISGT